MAFVFFVQCKNAYLSPYEVTSSEGQQQTLATLEIDEESFSNWIINTTVSALASDHEGFSINYVLPYPEGYYEGPKLSLRNLSLYSFSNYFLVRPSGSIPFEYLVTFESKGEDTIIAALVYNRNGFADGQKPVHVTSLRYNEHTTIAEAERDLLAFKDDLTPYWKQAQAFPLTPYIKDFIDFIFMSAKAYANVQERGLMAALMAISASNRRRGIGPSRRTPYQPRRPVVETISSEGRDYDRLNASQMREFNTLLEKYGYFLDKRNGLLFGVSHLSKIDLKTRSLTSTNGMNDLEGEMRYLRTLSNTFARQRGETPEVIPTGSEISSNDRKIYQKCKSSNNPIATLFQLAGFKLIEKHAALEKFRDLGLVIAPDGQIAVHMVTGDRYFVEEINKAVEGRIEVPATPEDLKPSINGLIDDANRRLRSGEGLRVEDWPWRKDLPGLSEILKASEVVGDMRAEAVASRMIAGRSSVFNSKSAGHSPDSGGKYFAITVAVGLAAFFLVLFSKKSAASELKTEEAKCFEVTERFRRVGIDRACHLNYRSGSNIYKSGFDWSSNGCPGLEEMKCFYLN